MAERPDGDREPWSDARLDAAFASIAPGGAPRTLTAEVALRLDDAARRRRQAPWFALAGLAAAALVVAVVGGALVTGLGPFAGYTVRTGDDGRSVFDTGEFSFSFPSAWQVTTTGQSGSGGSSIAVLGTQPVESRCGIGRADINCIYEQPLDRGAIRVFVGTSGFRGSSILDRPDAETGTTTRLTVGGMPAILDELDATSDGFYRADLDLSWQIARPIGLSQVVSIDVMARDPGAAEARAAAEALIASFRYASPPATLPPDDGAAVAAVRAMLVAQDDSLRQGIGQGSGNTPYGCQPPDPGVEVATTVGYSTNQDLGALVPATCTWRLEREGGTMWRVELRVDWTQGATHGVMLETLWLDAVGNLLHQQAGGDAPASVAVPATPESTDTPTSHPGDTPPPSDAVLGLPVMTVQEAIAYLATSPGDAEIAVEGWWSGSPAIPCPWDPLSETSPAYPRCPDGFSYLMADPEAVVTIGASGMSSRAPLGPYLAPLVRDGVRAPSAAVHTEGSVEPTRVIVLGHAHDHRAGLCPVDVRARCESAFVLDLAFEPGRMPPVVRLDELETAGADAPLAPAATEEVAVARARRATGLGGGDGQPDVPVVAVMRLAPDALARVEPALAERGTGMSPTGVTWLVKLLVPDGDVSRVVAVAMRDADLAPTVVHAGAAMRAWIPGRDGVQVVGLGP